MNKKHETIGRHIEAIELFEDAKKKRDDKVREMQRVLSPITDIMGATYGLDGTLAHLAKEAVELDAKMREWACEANADAKTLGKHPIEIKEYNR